MPSPALNAPSALNESALNQCVVSLLTPFLLTAAASPAQARAAATEAVTAYKATAAEQLVSITQILAFALIALDNLRLSLPEDVSLAMKLKLRGNANSLNRTSHRATGNLESQRRAAPQPIDPTEPLEALETAKTLLGQETPEATTPADLAWAGAMTGVAAEFKAELANLPQAEQNAHLIRINALSAIATQLASGTAPPLKARLLNSTALLTPQPAPSHSR